MSFHAELHTLAYGEPYWLKTCFPMLERYARRHHMDLRVWDDKVDPTYPHPKFCEVDALSTFLRGSADFCVWFDADILIDPAAPDITAQPLDGWKVAEDALSVSWGRKWAAWCGRHGLPTGRPWIYRNAGIWLCDRRGARQLLSHVRTPYIEGVMDQHMFNWWLYRTHYDSSRVQVDMLAKAWNRCVKHDDGPAWIRHLCGLNKDAWLADHALELPVRQGWRYFECDDCSHCWSLPTRDWRSPSSETCPECGVDTQPVRGRPDPALPVDANGNLIHVQTQPPYEQ